VRGDAPDEHRQSDDLGDEHARAEGGALVVAHGGTDGDVEDAVAGEDAADDRGRVPGVRDVANVAPVDLEGLAVLLQVEFLPVATHDPGLDGRPVVARDGGSGSTAGHEADGGEREASVPEGHARGIPPGQRAAMSLTPVLALFAA
jgi:hypothetical protein